MYYSTHGHERMAIPETLRVSHEHCKYVGSKNTPKMHALSKSLMIWSRDLLDGHIEPDEAGWKYRVKAIGLQKHGSISVS
jgi:hypothetical protein